MKTAAFLLLCLVSIATAVHSAPTFESVYQGPVPGGYPPKGGLTLGLDGNFYGVTSGGGTNGKGTVFRMSPAGQITTLVHFSGTTGPALGEQPNGPLLLHTDGAFWGTTYLGGTSNYGTIFRMAQDGTFTSIISFNDTGSTPGNPNGGLEANINGTELWGVAHGSSTYGGVYKITPGASVSSSLTYLTVFPTLTGPAFPVGKLLRFGTNFWGTSQNGGASNYGTVFFITSTGTVTSVHEFTGTAGAKPGANPQTGLVANGSVFYGTTRLGGSNDTGVVFRIASGTYSVLAHMSATGNTAGLGAYPNGLFVAPDNVVWGCAEEGAGSGFGSIFAVQTNFTVNRVISFTNSGATPGGKPVGSLTLGGPNLLYGTCTVANGGTGGNAFTLTTSGTYTAVANFGGLAALVQPDYMYGGLTKGPNGLLYGASPDLSEGYKGSIYTVDPQTKAVSVLVQMGAAIDIGFPYGAPVFANDGNLYGAANGGPSGYGGIYRCTTAGVITKLLDFTNNTGAAPGQAHYTRLTLAGDGKLYGVTRQGGSNFVGTVYRVSTDGTFESLASFTNGSTGAFRGGFPGTPLALGPDGNLYGITLSAGANSSGTIFRVSVPSGVVSTLVDFTGPTGAAPGSNTGGFLTGGMVAGSDGNLYGTMPGGGTYFSGVLFRLSPAGAYTLLYQFGAPGAGDAFPMSDLLLGTDGKIYGATSTNFFTAGKLFRWSILGEYMEPLHDMSGPDGAACSGGLVQLANGDIWGTTVRGGPSAASFGGTGTIYRLVAADPPLVTTLAVDQITDRTARMRGNTLTNGASTTVDFLLDGIIKNTVTLNDSGGTLTPSFTLTNLAGRTTYTARVRGTNRAGMVNGGDVSFSTLNSNPTATVKQMHAPALGIATSVYTAASDTSDREGDPRTLAVFSYGGTGTATTDGSTVSFTNGGFTGAETILVNVTDDYNGLSLGTIVLTNTAPIAPSGVVNITSGGNGNVSPLLFDPDGDTVTLSSFTQGANVSVVNNSGTLVVSAPSGYAGTDSFTITVGDGHGGSATGTVNVIVRDATAPGINSSPAPQTVQLQPGQSTYTLPDLRDQVIVTDNLAVASKSQQPAPGTAVSPGVVPVFFTVSDAAGNIATASTTITVLTAPLIAQDDLLFADTVKPTLLDVLRNDTRIGGGTLTITAVTQGSSGTVAIINGKVRYTPAPVLPVSGDTFTYTITGGAFTATATVRIVPAPPSTAQYAGLLLADPNDASTRTGLISLTFSTAGKFTGSLTLGYKKLAISGTIGTSSPSRVLITQTGFLPLELYLYAGSTTPGAPTLGVQINANDGPVRGTFSSTLERNPYNVGNPAPATGAYTFAARHATLPFTAISTIKVTNLGVATFAATAPDGTAFTYSSPLLPGSVLPFYSIVGTKAPIMAMVGELTFSDSLPDRHIAGSLEWRVPTGHTKVSAGSYTLAGIGSRYVAKTKPQDMLALNAAKTVNLTFTDTTNTTTPITRTLGSAATVTGAVPVPTLTFVPSTGLFSGTRKLTTTGAAQTFKGVVLQKLQLNRGTGLWLSPTVGAVDLTALP